MTEYTLWKRELVGELPLDPGIELSIGSVTVSGWTPTFVWVAFAAGEDESLDTGLYRVFGRGLNLPQPMDDAVAEKVGQKLRQLRDARRRPSDELPMLVVQVAMDATNVSALIRGKREPSLDFPFVTRARLIQRAFCAVARSSE